MTPMHAKALTVFIFLLMVGAAWPASQQKTLTWNDQSTYLYETLTTSGYDYFKLQPGFDGTFTSTLSIDDSKVLSYGPGGSLDGAVVCPGTTASLDSSLSASWSAPNFYAYATVWETCTPGASSATGGNFPVFWSQGDYNAMNAWKICDYNNPACWGYEGTLHDKQINFYDNYGVKISNRLGSVAVTCWGTMTPSATMPSGSSYPGLSSSDSGTSFQNTLTLNDPGSYVIGDSYEVKGCAATVRHPTCGSYQGEEVYSRTSAQAGTSAPAYDAPLGKNTYDITVQNKQNALSCGLSGVAQPLTVPPGGYIVIPITISNSGQAVNYVTGITSDNPVVTVAPFDSTLCAQNGGDRPSTNPECCANAPSCDSPPSNGFGPSQSISAGGSRTVYVQVAVPDGTTAGTYTANLAFSFSSDQSACNAAASQALSCSAGVLQVNVGGGDSCNITDGTMPVSTGDTRTFGIQCSHLNGDLGPCSGSTVSWDTTPPGFSTLGANDYQSAQVTFPSAGTGDVTASVSGDFNAVCAYSDNGQNVTVQDVNNCSITPSPADLGYSEITSFTLQCTDNGNSVPCGDVDWELYGIDGRVFNTGPTGASVFTQSPIGTTGQLNATIGPVSCSSDLTVTPPTDTLFVDPPSVSLPYNGSQVFTANCTHDGDVVACDGVVWNPPDFPQVEGSIDRTSGPVTNFTATVPDVDTELWACATGVSPSPCNYTSITVGAKPVTGVAGCNVTPSVADIGQLEVAVFGLQCFNESSDIVPCASADWELYGIDGILFDTSPTGASVVPTSDIGTTGQLNATVGNTSCVSNLTVVPPNNTLAIIPPSVNLVFMENQSFNTTCTSNGIPVPCTGVQWNMAGFPQVIGSIDPTSGPYTVYTATTDNVSTALWACAFDMVPPPCNTTGITVGTPPLPPECTGAGCGPGVSKYCTISPADAPDYYVKCGEPDNLRPCTASNVIWTFPGETCTGVTHCTVPLSSSGHLVATVGPHGEACELDLTGSSIYQCLQYT